MLSPELILIGGGVTHAGDLLMIPAEDTMRALALSEPLKHVRLGRSSLGEMAGTLGMIARLRELAAK